MLVDPTILQRQRLLRHNGRRWRRARARAEVGPSILNARQILRARSSHAHFGVNPSKLGSIEGGGVVFSRRMRHLYRCGLILPRPDLQSRRGIDARVSKGEGRLLHSLARLDSPYSRCMNQHSGLPGKGQPGPLPRTWAGGGSINACNPRSVRASRYIPRSQRVTRLGWGRRSNPVYIHRDAISIDFQQID